MSFARSMIVVGIVKSSAFAAFKFITSSNLVGCSTGISAGRVMTTDADQTHTDQASAEVQDHADNGRHFRRNAGAVRMQLGLWSGVLGQTGMRSVQGAVETAWQVTC